MDGHSDSLELRVLAGLQAGARLNLPDGRRMLGSGEACDIVLAGPGVEAQAMVIVVDGVQLHLQPCQPGCGLTAGDSFSEPFMLEAGVPFHLGDIWLVVDHPESPWPENRSWLVSMPPRLAALPMDAAITDAAMEDASRPAKLPDEPRPLLWWLKWGVWCIAVFCLGGLGILAWFKFGMEYLPNMRAMTVAHLTRFAESSVAGPAMKPAAVQPVEPVPTAKDELQVQKRPTVGLVLLSPAPAVPSIAQSPMLGLPLAGSHLVPSRSPAERADRGVASAAELSRLPFAVRQVVCGDVASITTDKGIKLFEGAIHKGYELTRVSPERLRLRGHHDVELPC